MRTGTLAPKGGPRTLLCRTYDSSDLCLHTVSTQLRAVVPVQRTGLIDEAHAP